MRDKLIIIAVWSFIVGFSIGVWLNVEQERAERSPTVSTQVYTY